MVTHHHSPNVVRQSTDMRPTQASSDTFIWNSNCKEWDKGQNYTVCRLIHWGTKSPSNNLLL